MLKSKFIALIALFALVITGCGQSVDPNVLRPGEHSKGQEGAKVLVYEYADFQCPACGFMQQLMKEAHTSYGDRVKFVYRHFPLISIHPNALPAAKASEAAARQGKFWEMHDKLFENQFAWSNEPESKKLFVTYAEELSLDTEQFLADFDSKEVETRIREDLKIAQKLGLNSTPTLIVNGQVIGENPRSFDQLKAILDASLKVAE